MELKYNDVFFHINQWFCGRSVDIVKDNGTAIVCVKFDEKSFPKTGYICGLSVVGRDHKKAFARLHVDKNKKWLIEWYESLGFKILSQDKNEYEMIKDI